MPGHVILTRCPLEWPVPRALCGGRGRDSDIRGCGSGWKRRAKRVLLSLLAAHTNPDQGQRETSPLPLLRHSIAAVHCVSVDVSMGCWANAKLSRKGSLSRLSQPVFVVRLGSGHSCAVAADADCRLSGKDRNEKGLHRNARVINSGRIYGGLIRAVKSTTKPTTHICTYVFIPTQIDLRIYTHANVYRYLHMQHSYMYTYVDLYT